MPLLPMASVPMRNPSCFLSEDSCVLAGVNGFLAGALGLCFEDAEGFDEIVLVKLLNNPAMYAWA